jgi:hypothetical protein
MLYLIWQTITETEHFWCFNTLATDFEILNLFSNAVLKFIYFDEEGKQLIYLLRGNLNVYLLTKFCKVRYFVNNTIILF